MKLLLRSAPDATPGTCTWSERPLEQTGAREAFDARRGEAPPKRLTCAWPAPASIAGWCGYCCWSASSELACVRTAGRLRAPRSTPVPAAPSPEQLPASTRWELRLKESCACAGTTARLLVVGRHVRQGAPGARRAAGGGAGESVLAAPAQRQPSASASVTHAAGAPPQPAQARGGVDVLVRRHDLCRAQQDARKRHGIAARCAATLTFSLCAVRSFVRRFAFSKRALRRAPVPDVESINEREQARVRAVRIGKRQEASCVHILLHKKLQSARARDPVSLCQAELPLAQHHLQGHLLGAVAQHVHLRRRTHRPAQGRPALT